MVGKDKDMTTDIKKLGVGCTVAIIGAAVIDWWRGCYGLLFASVALGCVLVAVAVDDKSAENESNTSGENYMRSRLADLRRKRDLGEISQKEYEYLVSELQIEMECEV